MDLIKVFGRVLLTKEPRKGMGRDMTLFFADGSSREIHVGDVVGLFLSSLESEHARLSGKPIPPSRFKDTLEMLYNATLAESEEPLLLMAWESARRHPELEAAESEVKTHDE